MFKGFKPRQDLIGFTAIPNEWFDEVMCSIDNLSEMKIVQAIFRKTYGWISGWDSVNKPVYKLEDSISYTQFYDLTGLSSASVSEGLKRAIAHGFIVQVEQGDFQTGKASRYRIRMLKDDAQTLEERPGLGRFLPSFNKEKGNELTVSEPQKETMESLVKALNTETPPEEKEVYSTADFDKKRNTQFDKYKEKQVADYNANDLTYYFSDRYFKVTGVRYSRIVNKERSHMKELLEDFGVEAVVKSVDYLMKNYRGLIDGYPSIAVLYGFRTTIVPSAIKGTAINEKLAVRESQITGEDIAEEKTKKEVIKW